MVQGAKHMKSNNAADNGGSSPQPKPQPKPKRRRKRLPRWADRLITIVIILIGVGLMTWPWILDRLEASGVFNQISTVSSTVDALSAEERERILLQARSFNEQLAGEATELPADQIEPYAQQLIFDRDPMMSWVEIPSIDVSMPSTTARAKKSSWRASATWRARACRWAAPRRIACSPRTRACAT